MNYLAFLQQIEKQEPQKLLLLVGGETYLRTMVLQILKKKLLTEPALNYQYLREDQRSDLESATGTYPFMDRYRLVVYEADKLCKEENKEESKRFWMLCQQIPESTYLVLVTEKAEKRKTLYQNFLTEGCVVELAPLKTWELEKWLVKKLAEYGKAIDPQAVKYMIQIIGSNLGVLQQEIEKILLYMGERDRITQEDLEAILARQTEQSIFYFLDALLARQLERSLLALHQLRRMEQPPLLILSMIQRELRLYWQVKIRRDKGYEKKQIKQELQIKYDFILEKYERYGDLFTQEELEQIWQNLLSTDLAFKDTAGDKFFLLEQLVLFIVQKK